MRHQKARRRNSAACRSDHDTYLAIDTGGWEAIDGARRCLLSRGQYGNRCVSQLCPNPKNTDALLLALEQNFHPYLQAFLPFLAPALKAYDDPQLCSVAVGLIGDICRALAEVSASYCDMFMTALLENLASQQLDRSVKISVVACFGDIAMAIGPAFEPYLAATMDVLRLAGEQKVDAVSGLRYLLEYSCIYPLSRRITRRLIITRNCVKLYWRHILAWLPV